jgi:hypothetical protein
MDIDGAPRRPVAGGVLVGGKWVGSACRTTGRWASVAGLQLRG